VLHWPLEHRSPNTVDSIKSAKIALVINIPTNFRVDELTNGDIIRRTAVDYNVMLITNRQLVMRLMEALSRNNIADLPVKSWHEYEAGREKGTQG
jgi:carbamoyl-phosphate synthase large subunit